MNEMKKYLVIKAIAQGKKTKKRACKEKKPSDTETEIENQNMQSLMKSKNVS
ncbi:transposase for insertion sequence [Streptococcus pneumoniae]|nr:transposase for insertion sequence [Streptococcus pneumoniae]